jgi:3-dehydroquinate dehydratase-1
MKQKQKPRPPSRPLVVATAHTLRGLTQAARLPRGKVDLVEVRLDLLQRQEAQLERLMPALKVPVLLTARHPAEGGAQGTVAAQRRAMLERFLPAAAALDVELRSTRALRPVLEAAASGAVRIVSFHDFIRTPSLPTLRKVVRSAQAAGADVVKIATQLRSAADLATLLQLQAGSSGPLATMGMGPLGRVSRLVLAAAGSRLNYGYLDRPQVPGQWPALELREMMRRVLP